MPIGKIVLPDNLNINANCFRRKKSYAHIDRYLYQPNDTAWFALYLVDAATHEPLEVDQIIYVELIDELDSVACRVKIAPDQNSCYFGHLPILEEYGIGKFMIRAYAPYMASSDEAYFFKREIIIGGTKQQTTDAEVSDYEIQFLPEGGQLLESTASYVAFKAIDENGLGISVGGDIVDNEDNIITSFESNNLGMGVFYLTAEPGKQYYARCRTERNQEIKKIKLPDANKQGYALQVKRANGRILVSVKSASDQAIKEPLYLLIHSRGIVQELIQWDKNKEFIAFQEKLFPAGILHMLLLDQQKQIRSERLVFCMNEADFAQVNFRTDKQAYNTREQIRSTIILKDIDNQPLQGRFSVSVTDNQNSYIDTLQTIASVLLLTSELKGYIESPGEYFRKSNRQATMNLDYLMMTQGWRRYDVPAILRQQYQEPVIEWDGGLSISGIVRGGYDSSPIEGSNLTLYAATGDYFASTETDKYGRFSFPLPNTIPDSTLFRAQLVPSLSYGNNTITFDTPTYPTFTRPYKGAPGTQIQTDHIFAWNIRLPDVGVTARKREPKPKPISDFTRYASHTLDQSYLESRPVPTWENVLANIPGARVLKNNNDIYVFLGRIGSLEATTPARIMLDGMLLSDNTFLSDIEILDVAQIDIIKGTRASIFGSEGMGGIISVTTKTASGTKRQTNGNIVKMVYPLGCQQPVEFYSPQYTTHNHSARKDLRKTLFWKPDIITNESGEAAFNFYSADVPTSYTILIEGVCNDGRLIHYTSVLLINNGDE